MEKKLRDKIISFLKNREYGVIAGKIAIACIMGWIFESLLIMFACYCVAYMILQSIALAASGEYDAEDKAYEDFMKRREELIRKRK